MVSDQQVDNAVKLIKTGLHSMEKGKGLLAEVKNKIGGHKKEKKEEKDSSEEQDKTAHDIQVDNGGFDAAKPNYGLGGEGNGETRRSRSRSSSSSSSASSRRSSLEKQQKKEKKKEKKAEKKEDKEERKEEKRDRKNQDLE